MSRANPMIFNFTAGELSPSLYGRADMAKYANGCKTLENMLTLPHGPAFKRPGTYYVAEVIGRDHVTNGVFSAGTWTTGTGWSITGGKAVGAAGTKSDISQDPADLVEDEVYETTYTLSDRTAGSVTMKIGGTSGTARTVDETYTERITCGATTVIAIEKSATFDGKIDDVIVRRVAPIARLESFEFSTVQAYILEFTDLNLRFYYKDSDGINGIILDSGDEIYEVTTPYLEADLFELQTTQSADIMYIWHPDHPEYQLTRTAHATWTLTKTDYANGPWEDSKTTTAIDPDGTTGSITLTSTDAIFEEEDIGRYIALYCTGSVWRYALITAYSTTKIVTATVKGSDLPDHNAVTTYKEGSFCDELGYPSCGDFYEERLVRAKDQTIYASASSDYDNMATGTGDDDAFVYTIASKGVNSIQWIVPQNVLLIGTKGAEWKMSSSGLEEPISVSNVFAKRQSTWGSMNMQALLINDVVLFVQRAGTKLRELTYSYEKDGYIAPDLAILAEHITEGGIVDLAYQQEPTAVVWAIRDDGVLLGMTYERTQDVVGWHRHLSNDGDDLFESVAVITTTTEDEVWVSVQRTIGTQVRRYVEYFKPWDWGTDRTNCFFVDSGLTSDGGAAKTITGATKADPVVITSAAHGFTDGDEVRILSVLGMTELNENIYIVDDGATNTFELTDSDGNDIDGTEFTTYVSGGTAQKVSKDYTGASHLAGRTVSILADGCVMPDVVVSATGTFTIAEYANKVHAGLGYTSKLQPMDIEAGAQAGIAQGKKKRIHKVTVRFKDTMACKMGTTTADLEEINFRDDGDTADSPVPLFTGDKDLNTFPGGHGTSGDVLIVNDVPLPMTVVAIMPELKTEDLI